VRQTTPHRSIHAQALACPLSEVCGVGPVLALQLLVEVGDPQRFRTEAQLHTVHVTQVRCHPPAKA
jgi:transposase